MKLTIIFIIFFAFTHVCLADECKNILQEDIPVTSKIDLIAELELKESNMCLDRLLFRLKKEDSEKTTTSDSEETSASSNSENNTSVNFQTLIQNSVQQDLLSQPTLHLISRLIEAEATQTPHTPLYQYLLPVQNKIYFQMNEKNSATFFSMETQQTKPIFPNRKAFSSLINSGLNSVKINMYRNDLRELPMQTKPDKDQVFNVTNIIIWYPPYAICDEKEINKELIAAWVSKREALLKYLEEANDNFKFLLEQYVSSQSFLNQNTFSLPILADPIKKIIDFFIYEYNLEHFLETYSSSNTTEYPLDDFSKKIRPLSLLRKFTIRHLNCTPTMIQEVLFISKTKPAYPDINDISTNQKNSSKKGSLDSHFEIKYMLFERLLMPTDTIIKVNFYLNLPLNPYSHSMDVVDEKNNVEKQQIDNIFKYLKQLEGQ